jgi:opacity protein-like surface antigen
VFRKFLCLSVFFLSAAAAFGQAIPTALRGATLEAGGQFNIVRPDYGEQWMYGFGGVVDANARKWWGLEAEADFAFLHGPSSTKEETYNFGPRFLLVHERWTPYAKVLIGFGHITLPNPGHPTSTNLDYSFGGGVDWRWKPKITIRVADVEYQQWPNFSTSPDVNNPYGHGGALTPLKISVGVKYRFFQ